MVFCTPKPSVTFGLIRHAAWHPKTFKTLSRRQTDYCSRVIVEMHLTCLHANGCEYYILFTSWALWDFFFSSSSSKKTKELSQQASDHTVWLPFNQYLSPISTWFPLLHHSICLSLCDCRHLGNNIWDCEGSFSQRDWLTAICPCYIRNGCKETDGGAVMRKTERKEEIMGEREASR